MWDFAPESESSLSYCCSDSERICQYLPFCDAVYRYFEYEKSNPLPKTEFRIGDLVLFKKDFNIDEGDYFGIIIKVTRKTVVIFKDNLKQVRKHQKNVQHLRYSKQAFNWRKYLIKRCKKKNLITGEEAERLF